MFFCDSKPAGLSSLSHVCHSPLFPPFRHKELVEHAGASIPCIVLANKIDVDYKVSHFII